MPLPRLLPSLTLAVAVLLGVRLTGTGAEPPVAKAFPAGDVAFFEKEVQPILQARCHKCHGEGKVKGGLRLTSRENVLKGGDTGPAVTPEKPDDSLLLKAIHYQDGLEMPPTGKLPPQELDALARWVKAGVPWTPAASTAVKGPDGHAKPKDDGRSYWAYQPLRRPPVPQIRDPQSVNPIDAFLHAKRQAAGLGPNPPADRVTLVRRAYYDLTGLPPMPEQVDAFVNDPSPDAWPRLIDRLLDSPQYGEQWGRHWLDLVRYAETNGYERDGPKPFAWRFRDYVIKSFNADKPFDRFVREQLAGDELPGFDPDAIIATGYYRLGLWDDEPADPLQARFDELDDIVATTAQVFLGMTMNCARCHDHKIDPIPQKDYYSLLAFFADVPRYSMTRSISSRTSLTDITPPAERAKYEADLKQRRERIDELTAAMTKIEDAAIKTLPGEDQRAAEGIDRPQVVVKLPKVFTDEQAKEYRTLKAELTKLQRMPQPGELALSVNQCLVRPPATHVMIRGNPHAPGAEVAPAFPAVLSRTAPAIPEPCPGAKSSGRRTVLANWIASKDNPLPARVLANRLWQYHFGRGIVPSSNDFGKFGERPTHPELLDWLASELIDGGWTLKRMHRLIMLSSAYQMSSRADAAALKADPANALFWRFNMRRLTAEEVRDSVLAVSGRLNPKAGGPSAYPPIPKAVLAGQSRPGEGWPQSPPAQACRRSVYVHVKRSLLVPVLAHHDAADTDSSCPVRYTTTVPTQALGMLNGEFTQEQAAALAERLRREAPGDLTAQVRRALRLTAARVPGEDEVRRDMDFVRDLQERQRLSAEEALKQYALLLLNTNEFVYLD
jgi:hypothetical protein